MNESRRESYVATRCMTCRTERSSDAISSLQAPTLFKSMDKLNPFCLLFHGAVKNFASHVLESEYVVSVYLITFPCKRPDTPTLTLTEADLHDAVPPVRHLQINNTRISRTIHGPSTSYHFYL